MAIDYRVEEDWNCVLNRVFGRPTPAEFEAFIAALTADERIRPQHVRFTDLRGAYTSPNALTVSAFARASAEYDLIKPPSRAAILVDRDVDFGMSRVFVGHQEESEIYGVFRSLDAALSWLGWPPGQGDPFQTGDWIDVGTAFGR